MEKILYVDDEEINISIFTMSFEKKFNVIACRSGEEALNKFKENGDVAVVISDQRMPGMTGVELLSEIYRLNPDPIRMILTAYSDSSDVIDAVNKGHIYQYIQKPWNLGDLRQRLSRAVDMFTLAKSNRRLFEEIEEKNIELMAANQQLKKEIELQAELEKQRRAVEIKLLAQSKLASLGEIATGIAHELNQPITYIKIITESIRRDLQCSNLDLNELSEDMLESAKQIKRISKIIDHLRVFGREDPLETSTLLLSETLKNSLILFGNKIANKHIKLNYDISEQLYPLEGNDTQLEQVMINLFQNSIDALDGTDAPEINISIHNNSNDVLFVFKDNGLGMNSQTMERIFEPFFTTKEVGKGTGVGLSIVYGIIKEHKGTIECESSPGQGTVFTITLPAMN